MRLWLRSLRLGCASSALGNEITRHLTSCSSAACCLVSLVLPPAHAPILDKSMYLVLPQRVKATRLDPACDE